MLFSPIRVGPVTLKNRISYSPTLTGFASVDGEVTRLILDYYRRLAQGGAGMIFVGSCSVDYPWSRNNYCPLRIDDDRFIFGLNKLAETIQETEPWQLLNYVMPADMVRLMIRLVLPKFLAVSLMEQ